MQSHTSFWPSNLKLLLLFWFFLSIGFISFVCWASIAVFCVITQNIFVGSVIFCFIFVEGFPSKTIAFSLHESWCYWGVITLLLLGCYYNVIINMLIGCYHIVINTIFFFICEWNAFSAHEFTCASQVFFLQIILFHKLKDQSH